MIEKTRITSSDFAWRKSSYSGAQSECVEVAAFEHTTAIRDSKDRGRGHLAVSNGSWQALVDAAIEG
ncbi:hypothetical protein B4N89_14375 [Embleya scabrispora]|uniref:DUF397 domain-containing protein n=1 Tax=Embleya scabrispora TaxID=159449 RepID=A0A1T3NYX8_9ACTN|nr:DUF397 domain-containing protein [Embleya scabrispora]OPC81964.1 hypothetical protein B4N89_14375 [Embleya scabrispora]